MTRSGARAVHRLARSPLAALTRRGDAGDGGFILLESMMAITLITVLAAALGTFFVNGVAATNQQRARQFATQVAATAIEGLRSIPASDLKTGRDQNSVTQQFQAASPAIAPWIDPALMSRNFSDGTAPDGSGASALVPTSATPMTINGKSFTLNRYLGRCAAPSGNSADCTVARLSDATAVTYIRAAVAVSWSDSHCAAGTCVYATGTVLTDSEDATFNLNQIPFTPPVVVNPGSQNSMVTDTVSLPVAVRANTGVPTITWGAANLPAGLTIDPASGLITGTLTAPVTNQSVTVTARDGFVRSASATFTWTVTPQIAASAIGTPTATVGTPVTPLTLTATGGSGTGYAWSDPTGTLPPGLTVASSTGAISGTPTKAGSYSVQLTVTDSANHKATTTGRWTVGYPPLVPADPGPQTSTVNTAIASRQLTATGGSGIYTWAATGGLPPGLSLSPAGVISGRPTAIGTTTVTTTVTDPGTSTTRTLTFSWTVDAQPSVTAPGPQTTSVGASINLGLASTCPNTPCTYALTSGPAGLSVTAAGVITGTVSGTAQTYPSARVTITDAAGASVASTPFPWTVKAAPSVTAPVSQTTTVGAGINIHLATTCPNNPCTYSITGAPSGLSVTAAGVITGTVSGSAQSYPSATVTVTDVAGSSTTSAAFQWTVNAAPTMADPGAQTVYVNTPDSLDLTTLRAGGTAPFVYSAAGLPTWLTLNPTTGLISGTAPAAKAVTSAITVTVTDAAGVSATSGSFKWIVTDLRMPIPDLFTAPRGAGTMDLDNYAAGGSPAYTFAVSGSLPGWLSYNTTSHVISGTAPSAGSDNPITVTATDTQGAVVATTFHWFVSSLQLTIGNQVSTAASTINVDVDNFITGTATSVTVTGRPAWLTYNTTTHALGGTAPATGTVATGIVVTATDTSGFAVRRTIRWNISDLRWSGLPGSGWSTAHSTSVSVDMKTYDFGGTGPFTYTATGLPAGLTIDAGTGVVSGTTSATVKTYSVTVTVTDSLGATATTAPTNWKIT